MTPTQRSLKLLRDRGYLCAVVEKWIPQTPAGYKGPILRSDLFGFADILAIKDDDCLLVQTTSGSNVSARVAKIFVSGSATVWKLSPHRRIMIHGWRKVGERGKRKLWECREVEV